MNSWRHHGIEQDHASLAFTSSELKSDWRNLTAGSILSVEEFAALSGLGGLTIGQADHMIENVVGLYALPLGIALNFLINGREVLVPMVIEEPSVVAGASFMAKLARRADGFIASTTPPEMIAQIQILDVTDLESARTAILEARNSLLEEVTRDRSHPKKTGRRAARPEVRLIEESPIGPFLVVHLIIDVRDAMGANALNTAAESLAPRLAALSGGRVHLRILSNLADRRLASARCTILLNDLAFQRFQRGGSPRWDHRCLGICCCRSLPGCHA